MKHVACVLLLLLAATAGAADNESPLTRTAREAYQSAVKSMNIVALTVDNTYILFETRERWYRHALEDAADAPARQRLAESYAADITELQKRIDARKDIDADRASILMAAYYVARAKRAAAPAATQPTTQPANTQPAASAESAYDALQRRMEIVVESPMNIEIRNAFSTFWFQEALANATTAKEKDTVARAFIARAEQEITQNRKRTGCSESDHLPRIEKLLDYHLQLAKQTATPHLRP